MSPRFRSMKSRLATVVAAGVLAAAVGLAAPAEADVVERASSSSGSSTTRDRIELARPAGTTAGDVMVAAVAANNISGFTAPPGWALVRNDAVDNVIRQAVYLKVAGADEPSTYTWTLPGHRRVTGGITAYRNVDPTDPIDDHAGATRSEPGTTLTAPSVTTTVPGARLVHLATVNAEGDLHPGSGLTERWEADSPNPKNDNDVLTAAADTTQPDPGPTPTRTITATNPGPRITAVLALRPADSPPPDDDPPDTDPPPPVEVAFIETVAGTGTAGFSGDGGPATDAMLDQPRTMATDAAGNIFFVDTDNHRVRRIDAITGLITTIAGTGTAGYSGDGGPAVEARLDTPHGVAVDAAGNVYVADSPNQRIRRISPDGVITTVAGTGDSGYNGDGIPATSAQLSYPKGVAIGPDGSLYIGDANNHRVRRVDPSGIITTVAGTGTAGYSGDGGPATEARLRKPRNVAVDAAGTLYIADDENNVVRRVDLSGIITTVAGTGTAGYSGDGGPATAARLGRVRDVAVDAAGRIYIADEQNDRIRMVDPAGVITTLAGTGTRGFSGDGGPPAEARVKAPRGVAVDAAGRVLIGDTGNNRIRRVTLP